MTTLRCLVVDDESMGRKLIEENIRQFPSLELVASCKNAFEAMQILHDQKIDLMFLDIQMPGLTGTQLLSSLPHRPMVVFVTAYPQYALEGFELDVLDYLMKPVNIERFTKAVQKALLHHQAVSKSNSESPDVRIPADDYFFVNVEYSLVKIVTANILFIEGMKDYVKIFLETQDRPVITKTTLKNLESKLPENLFMRTHKSFIVNIHKIQSIRGQQLTIGKHEIPVSENNLAELMKRLKFSDKG